MEERTNTNYCIHCWLVFNHKPKYQTTFLTVFFSENFTSLQNKTAVCSEKMIAIYIIKVVTFPQNQNRLKYSERQWCATY